MSRLAKLFGAVLLISIGLLALPNLLKTSILFGTSYNAASYKVYYFINQRTYQTYYGGIKPMESWLQKFNPLKQEYQYQVDKYLSDQCDKLYGLNRSRDLISLPQDTLANMIVDEKRRFAYTAVHLAGDGRWTKFIMDVQGKNESKSLLTMDVLLKRKRAKHKQTLYILGKLFTFYIVRNPFERLIAGYEEYFSTMEHARNYLDGKAMQELRSVNNITLETILETVSFEQYMKWIVHGNLSEVDFYVQSLAVKPCHFHYSLNGFYENTRLDIMFIKARVRRLRKSIRSHMGLLTLRQKSDLLARKARQYIKTRISYDTMELFYQKYHEDYVMFNYSKPGDWWYPYPGVIKGLRRPNPLIKKFMHV